MARLISCDRCGATEKTEDGEDYVKDWETVTISTNYHYDLCDKCGKLLFQFFEKAQL